ncbi:MAG: hypothetical protein DLM71_10040 [Chloroflexi bacterium]|nr:MAG: hypothetical protein DLM71_10040 [Chloroflexota bacterium]
MAVAGARPVSTFPIFGRRLPVRPRRTTRAGRRPGTRRHGREISSVSGFLLAIAAAAGLALFYLSQSAHVAATGYQIDTLQSRLGELQAEQQALIAQIGQARSASDIGARARSQLGLVPLDQTVVRFAGTSIAHGN